MDNEQLYPNIKAAFVAKKTTLNEWCTTNKKHRQNVRAAVLGLWQGEGASLLVDLVVKESGLAWPSERDGYRSPSKLRLIIRASDIELYHFFDTYR